MTHPIIAALKGGLIVSCQALEHEPLFGSHIMAAMACAAEEGGARAIRANTPQDIAAIKDKCSLPVIGLYKKHYAGSPVYITPTIAEVRAIIAAGSNVVAIDCTSMKRPGDEKLSDLIAAVRQEFPAMLIMADISTFQEGVDAMELGVDIVSTTMSGYTPHSPQRPEPDVDLVRRLAALGRIPVFAEGRIWSVEDCLRCYDAGAHAVVVGTAITRPQEVVKRYVSSIRTLAGIVRSDG